MDNKLLEAIRKATARPSIQFAPQKGIKQDIAQMKTERKQDRIAQAEISQEKKIEYASIVVSQETREVGGKTITITTSRTVDKALLNEQGKLNESILDSIPTDDSKWKASKTTRRKQSSTKG